MKRGFTLIELLIVITIIMLMVAAYYVVANPAGQLASARNSTRTHNLEAILLAVRSNIGDQLTGQFSCPAGPLPTSSTDMGSATSSGQYDIVGCLTPILKGMIPFDPSAPGAHFNSAADYDTGYSIMIDASGTITLTAPSAELGKPVSIKG